MKTKRVFRILVPILLLLASFTSRAAITDTVYVSQGQCVSVVDSIINGIFVTIDSSRTLIAPSQGTVFLDTAVNSQVTYCANGNAANSDAFVLYVCLHPNAGGPEVCDTVYVTAIINHTCTMSVTLVQDTFTCPGANRSFEVSTINAQPPLTFQWSNNSNTGYHACETDVNTPICVAVTDAMGCVAYACADSLCHVGIIFTPVFTCPGPYPGVSAVLIGGAGSVVYNWSDGSISPTVCFGLSPGTYSLTATDSIGCVASGAYTYTANQSCMFYYTVDSATNNVSFISVPDSTLQPIAYHWDFGDSTTSTALYPNHNYNSIGRYIVTMTIEYSANNITCQYIDTVNVHTCNVGASIVTGVCGGSLPSLQAVGFNGVAPYSYSWSNGDTSQVQCNLSPGIYCVSVFDHNGCGTTQCYTVNPQGNCSFTYQLDPVLNYVSFYGHGDSINNTITGYSWNLGIGTFSGSRPTALYPQSGSYQINMTVYYSTGDSCQFSQLISVHDTTQPCQLQVTIDSVGNNCSALLQGLSAVVTAGTAPYSYLWTDAATTQTVCAQASAGYSVTVTDAHGCNAIAYYNVGYSIPCNFNYVVDSVTNSVTFFAEHDTAYSVASYTWNFGDSTTASGSTAMHVYHSNGTYPVTISQFFTNGDSCIITNPVPVHPTHYCYLLPTIDTLSTICGAVFPGLYVVVTGSTPPYTYQWSTGQTTDTICATVAGSYVVTVTDGFGCSNLAVYTINGQSTSCSFTSGTDSSTHITYFSSSIGSNYAVTGYHWDFGDSTSGSGPAPYHVYVNGTYLATMNVYFSNGDTCSYSDYVFVYDSISAACQSYFYHTIDSNNNNTFHFVDYSSYNPLSWTWDFGDGTTSNLQNPTHSYSGQSSWTVCLTTNDSSGCSSNYCETISNIPVQDVEAFLYHGTTVTPGFPVWVYLDYYNAGTIVMNGTLTYKYPAGTTVTVTSVTPLTLDTANRIITFPYSGLYPYSSDQVYVELQTDVNTPIGSIAEDTLWVNPIAGDVTPSDNVSFINDTVTGSWDPNNKSVSPKGEGREGIVPITTEFVSYIIHFQNTGNGIAHKVVLRDTIDNNIDLSTVEETKASHDHVTQLIGNQLVVTFHNINLPDSGSNQAASQGYIMLRAKLKPSLTSGTRITNTAAIYFDFNAPVMTNTVVTTLFDKSAGISNIERFDFALVPNPASSMVTLRGEFTQGSTYEVINQLGQILMTGEVKANNTNLSISKLAGGVYLVKVISGEKVGIERLTIAR